MSRALRLAPVLALLAAGAAAEVLHLTNGDRITGKTLARAKLWQVQTPHGKLAIAREAIGWVERDDGSVEVVSGMPPTPAPTPTPTPEARSKLVLAITGTSFWYAWDGKDPGAARPALRCELRLDEEPLVTFTDSTTDPDRVADVVNAFSFAADEVAVSPAAGVGVEPAEVRPGRIVLRLEVPLAARTQHVLRIAYQTAEGDSWRDVASTSLSLELRDGPTLLEVAQDRGLMEFAKRRMKNADTFEIRARTQ
jgi:hypothetical protein